MRGSSSQTHFEQIASLVNRLSEFINFAGFKLYGFIADTAEGEMRRRTGSHETASRANHQNAQETGHPEWGSSGRDLLELSTRDRRSYVLQATVRGCSALDWTRLGQQLLRISVRQCAAQP